MEMVDFESMFSQVEAMFPPFRFDDSRRQVWIEILRDCDAGAVATALIAYAKTGEKHAPLPGQLRQEVKPDAQPKTPAMNPVAETKGDEELAKRFPALRRMAPATRAVVESSIRYRDGHRSGRYARNYPGIGGQPEEDMVREERIGRCYRECSIGLDTTTPDGAQTYTKRVLEFFGFQAMPTALGRVTFSGRSNTK